MASEAWGRLRTTVARPNPLAFCAALLIVYGAAHTDFKDFAALSAHPFAALADPGRQFLHSSPLPFFLGWPVARLAGANAAYAVVTAGGVLALAVALAVSLRPLTPEQRRAAGLVLMLSPLPLALLSWIGKSDTFVLAAYLGYARRRGETVSSALFVLLMVLGHKEIGTVILLGDALLARRLPLAAVVGLLAGHVVVDGYASLLDRPILSRFAIGLAFLHPAIEGWAADPVAHLVLTFDWAWMLVLPRLRDPDRVRVAAAVLLCFAASFTASDYTRVFALCSVPILRDVALRLAADPGGAARLCRWRVAGLALLQLQLVAFNQVRDSHWPDLALDALRRAGLF